MPFIGKQFASNSKITNYTTTVGSGGQTNFTVIIEGGDETHVYLNGVLLKETTDYTVSSTQVSLVSPAVENDIVEIKVFRSFSLVDAVKASGGTFSGNITIPTGTASGHAVTKAQLDASGVSGITSSADGTAISIDSSEVVTVENKIKVDDIEEKTSAHGVEIDGVILKDSGITANFIQPTSGQNVVLKQDTGQTALTIDANGNVETVNHIEQADGKYVQTDEIRARDTDGLKLHDDDGNGIFIEDGGKIGIGTTSPDRLLHLKRNDTSTDPSIRIEQDGTGDASLNFLLPSTNWTIGADNSDSDKFKISPAGSLTSEVLTITTSGNVGIGTSTPGGALHVSYNEDIPFQVDGDGTRRFACDDNANDLFMFGTWQTSMSDKGLKNSIVSLTGMLDKILQTKPITYKWNEGVGRLDSTITHYGVLAQEIREVFPSLVYEDEDGHLNVRRDELQFILMQAVKELSAKVTALENA